MGNTFVQIWAETSLFCLEQLWMDNKWVDYWRQCLYFKEVSFRSMPGSQSSWVVVCLEPDFQRNSWSPGEQHHLLCFILSSEILLWCNSPSTPTQFLEVAVKQVNSVNSVNQLLLLRTEINFQSNLNFRLLYAVLTVFLRCLCHTALQLICL